MRKDECKDCKRKIRCNVWDRARRTACKDYVRDNDIIKKGKEIKSIWN